jgi:predicted Zn finger-like uncharacterized protein
MIVTCHSCQARFRIPDEKIGPRGAKVRCSKCKNVFVVRHPEIAPGAASAQPLAVAPPPLPRSPPPAPPPLPAAAPVPPLLPDLGLSLEEPSRSHPALLAGPASPPPDDPFGVPVPIPDGAAASDPFGLDQGPDPFAPVGDPFAAAVPLPADPRAAVPPRHADHLAEAPPHQAMTNLSDLAGAGMTALAPPLPDLGPPPFALGPPPFAGEADALALQERTPSDAPVRGMPALAEPGRLDAALAPGEPSGLELGGWDARPPAEPAAEIAPPRRPPAPARREKTPAPPREEAVAAGVPPGQAVPETSGRFHALLVNSLSLAALLLVTLVLLYLWRGEERPFFGEARQGHGAVMATQVANGIYETPSGRRLLFVRGSVRSRSPVPLGAVTVRAELLRGEEVVARAEGLAGAVPSPEELSALGGGEDAERLRAAVIARAARQVRPGEAVPFLLTFTEYPADLGEVVFRVAAEAAPAGQGG